MKLWKPLLFVLHYTQSDVSEFTGMLQMTDFTSKSTNVFQNTPIDKKNVLPKEQTTSQRNYNVLTICFIEMQARLILNVICLVFWCFEMSVI